MERPQVRPHLELESRLPPREALARLRRKLATPDGRCRGTVLDQHVEVTICDRDRHFWSPQISLTAEPHGDGAVLRGRIGPQPQVWTMLVALYAVIGFTTLFAAVFAASQWMVDHTLWALWTLPAGVVAIALVYGIAYVGQRLGADQAHTLMDFVDDALERAGTPAGPPGPR